MSEAINVCICNEIRYLGTYTVQSRQFKCSLDNAKKSIFHRLTLSLVKLVEMHPKKTHPGVN